MADPSVTDLTTVLGERLSLTADKEVTLNLDDGSGVDPTGGGWRGCLVGTVLIKKMRVLAVGPWCFANHVMVLKEAKEGHRVAREELYEVPFWIQIHGLPLDRMMAITGRRVGEALRRLVEVDDGGGNAWGVEYIRMSEAGGAWWLRDSSGNRVTTEARWRRPIPRLGSSSNMETGGLKADSNQRDWGRNGLDSSQNQDEIVPFCGIEQQKLSVAQQPILQVQDSRRGKGGVKDFVSISVGVPVEVSPLQAQSSNISNPGSSNVEGGPVFFFQSSQCTTSPKTRTWKKEARECKSVPSHFKSVVQRMKRKDNTVQEDDLELGCYEKRSKGEGGDVRSLIELVGLKKLAVVFLCETLLDRRGMDRIRQRLRFHNCFTVDKIGRSGGLAMLWTSEVSLSLLSYSTNHIDIEVEEIREKLDRGLATARWHDTFPHAIVRLLTPLAFDHKPLWIRIDGRRDRRNRHRKRFRFEEMWLRDYRCQEVVQASWKSIEGIGDWGCLLHKMKEFERLSHHQDLALAAKEERCVLNELEEWLEREEIMWRQRSRDIWIQEGDRNTCFFHRRATKRNDRNRVEKLMKDTREWTSSFGEVKVVVTEYFTHLFTSTDPTNLALVTDCLKPCVQDGDNSFLLHELTEVEVTKALFQMHPSKSPGPDSLSPIFFQRFWVPVKDDIVQPCLQYLNQGIPFLDDLNLTNIVLIPKCPEPKAMGDLRPISLCNVIYRVLAKVLANRFKKRRKRGWQAIKLAMSKAFDRVEWPYLVAVMKALGFAERWISLIMGCVTSVQPYNNDKGCREEKDVACNVPSIARDRVTGILGMKELSSPGRYLGFPAQVSKAKARAFSDLKSKFRARICDWRKQPLSKAGREIHWIKWRKLATPKKMGGLGFRALHEFNLAMLGKQGWRLLVNPDSLVAQLLKAKYYPRSDLLHAGLKPSCSFTWRSICSATTLLRQGQFYVQSPPPADYELRYVCDLIDADSHYWKHYLIRAISNPHEAQLILSMPLSWLHRDDGWTWRFTRQGSYSVRSVYHRAMAMGGSHAGPSPSSSSFRGGPFWNLDIPEKVRLMIWQAYRNILPTKDNLMRRRVEVDLDYPMCGMEQESVFHCLVACAASRASSRNDALWNDRSPNPQLIIEQSLGFLDEYRRVMALQGRGPSVSHRMETRWTPPVGDHVKINVDGAVLAHQRIYGMGAIAWNSSGAVVAAMSCKGQGIVCAEIAEACCLRKALQWACELSFEKVIMESDCASLVTAMNSFLSGINSSLGTVLSDCKLLMASINNCHVKFIRRVGNSMAHELARRALHAKDDEYWTSEVPPFLAHIVSKEMP
ncbi:hypothetical protein SLEP1_g3851 [Rubroshorea leprosula]|uniref:RNase H type-1 domain-containing protein n=1 Tax=Rubroshorea leprosula TaxID=152421 RepID=A0AAV5HXK7_9ROSI|nr:hypothetical protein SLEP1_g3851 [Rubroshorea leprosula]